MEKMPRDDLLEHFLRISKERMHRLFLDLIQKEEQWIKELPTLKEITSLHFPMLMHKW
jgi:hypothetical protein